MSANDELRPTVRHDPPEPAECAPRYGEEQFSNCWTPPSAALTTAGSWKDAYESMTTATPITDKHSPKSAINRSVPARRTLLMCAKDGMHATANRQPRALPALLAAKKRLILRAAWSSLLKRASMQ